MIRPILISLLLLLTIRSYADDEYFLAEVNMNVDYVPQVWAHAVFTGVRSNWLIADTNVSAAIETGVNDLGYDMFPFDDADVLPNIINDVGIGLDTDILNPRNSAGVKDDVIGTVTNIVVDYLEDLSNHVDDVENELDNCTSVLTNAVGQVFSASLQPAIDYVNLQDDIHIWDLRIMGAPNPFDDFLESNNLIFDISYYATEITLFRDICQFFIWILFGAGVIANVRFAFG